MAGDMAVVKDGAMTQILSAFVEFGIPMKLVTYLSQAVERIFTVVRASGVQTIIFIAALQSISSSLYEVAKIEGATTYETFWKVTFPMVSPMIVTVVVYTIVDSFLRSEICDIMDIVYRDSEYGYYAAMSWIYILASLLIMGVVVGILSKVVFYYDDKK